MTLRQNLEQITLYLDRTLVGYEVIPANWGWHIHQENVYCGHLEYQETKGWQGSALDRLPQELQEQLKQFALSALSQPEATNSSLSLV